MQNNMTKGHNTEMGMTSDTIEDEWECLVEAEEIIERKLQDVRVMIK